MVCRRWNNHVDVRFQLSRSLCFPSKDRRDAIYERGNGWKGVDLPRESAILLWSIIIKSTFPYFLP